MIDSTDTNITQGKFKDWIKTSNSANPMSGSGGRGEKNEKGRSLFFLPHSWEDEDRLLEKCGVDALKTGHTYTHTWHSTIETSCCCLSDHKQCSCCHGNKATLWGCGQNSDRKVKEKCVHGEEQKVCGGDFLWKEKCEESLTLLLKNQIKKRTLRKLESHSWLPN